MDLPVPAVLTKTIGYIADLDTPLAMFTIGVFLAQTDLPGMVQLANLLW